MPFFVGILKNPECMLIPLNASILNGILLIYFIIFYLFYFSIPIFLKNLPFIQLANIYSGSTLLGSGSKEEKNETLRSSQTVI